MSLKKKKINHKYINPTYCAKCGFVSWQCECEKGDIKMIEKLSIMHLDVPTDLGVRVNGIHNVYYKKLEECFGYEFRVFPKENAEDAIEEVVSMMENQSFDHGASWRRVSLEEVYKEDTSYRFFVVKFRIRDAG